MGRIVGVSTKKEIGWREFGEAGMEESEGLALEL
jgi:hypothetical protein